MERSAAFVVAALPPPADPRVKDPALLAVVTAARPAMPECVAGPGVAVLPPGARVNEPPLERITADLPAAPFAGNVLLTAWVKEPVAARPLASVVFAPVAPLPPTLTPRVNAREPE